MRSASRDRSVQEYLDDPRRGFGEDADPASSSAYVRVAAVPSATVVVHDDADAVGRFRWGDLSEDGDPLDGDGVRVGGRSRQGRNWVHVTVLDEDTGKPVPCRVHFRSPEGVPYQPHGHHDHVNSDLGTWHIDVGGDLRLGRTTYAYIDGTCQGWLPRGDVIVDAVRGFEYEPLRQVVHIEPDRRELTLRLRRWARMNEEGWYSGDSHVHFLSAQGSLLEQQGRRPERGEPPPEPVGEPVHQHGGLHGRSRRSIGRPVRHVGEPGEPAALLRSHGALGPAAAGDAVVHRRPVRGRAGLVAGDDPERLGRRRPRAGGDGRDPALPAAERRACHARSRPVAPTRSR